MEFGFSLVPTADLTAHQDLVAAAEADGLDLVGVQDHPYAPALVDTFALIPYLLAHTQSDQGVPGRGGAATAPGGDAGADVRQPGCPVQRPLRAGHRLST